MKKILENKFYLAIFISIISVVFGVLVEVFCFNYHPVFFGDDSFLLGENKTKISYDDPKFVKDLHISYQTEKNTSAKISYEYVDVFGKIATEKIEDNFYSNLSESYIVINKKIKGINIESDGAIERVAAENSFYFSGKRVFAVTACILLVFIIIVFAKKKIITKKLPELFMITGLLLGSSFIVLQPAFTFYSWDDQIHFQRTLEVFYKSKTYSAGEYASIDAGNTLGKNSVNSMREADYLENTVNSMKNTDISMNGHFPSFSVLPYLPGTIAYHSCRLIGLPYSICFRMGKIFLLLAYLLIVGFAIKKAKIGKLLLFVISLLPINLFQATSYSYDYAVFSGVALFFSVLINLFVDKDEKFDFENALIIFISIGFASLAKSVYALLLLLFIFIPKDRFLNKKYNITMKICAVILSITMCLAGILAVGSTSEGDFRGGNDVSTSKQISLVLQNPVDYANVLWDNAGKQFFSYLIGKRAVTRYAYIGEQSDTSNIYYFAIIILLLSFFVSTEKEHTLKIKNRVEIILAILVLVIVIWSALYASFTPVGSRTINGVQERYFCSLLWPLLLCFSSNKIIYSGNKDKLTAIIIAAVCVIFILYSVNTLGISFCL